MRHLIVEPKALRFVWGGVALFVYLVLVGLLLFYFNHRQSEKPKHFVKKDEKRIALATMAPEKIIKINTIVEKPKKIFSKQTKKIEPVKVKPKSVKNTKLVPPKKKAIIKEKIVKKVKPTKKDLKLTKQVKQKPKKIYKPKVKKVEKKLPKKVKEKVTVNKTADLFSSVKTKTTKPKILVKNKISTTQKSVDRSKKRSDSGIENAYFAKVQNLLETWPAQSDYAGEKAMVQLYVKPTGLFEFKVKSQSDNVAFNLGLIDFLMQLQKLGFGAHKGGKIYEFEVEFVAKE